MLSQKATRLNIQDDEEATDSTLQHETPPSSPNGSSTEHAVPSGNIWPEFSAAANTLAPGACIRHESLSPYDTVGSLEMMDPKMDSGLLAREGSAEDDFDVAFPLSPAQVLGVMDDLLRYEMAWHQGFPLSRTLLASRHLTTLLSRRSNEIEEVTFTETIEESFQGSQWVHTVLRAYCLATIKASDFIIRKISSEKYHEEEDFNTNTFECDFFTDIDAAPFQSLLMQAFDYADRAEVVDEGSATDFDPEVLHAIRCRLEFRQYFLYAVEESHERQMGVSQLWEDCERTLRQITATHSHSESVPAAFSQKLQRIIAAHLPPKPLIELSWEESTGILDNLIKSAANAQQILHASNFENLITYVRLLAAQDPQPPVYVRSVMQTFTWSGNYVLGRYGYKEALFLALEETVLPISNIVSLRNDLIEATHDPRHIISRQMETFARTVTDAFLDVFVHQCMNRARLERDLSKAISMWESLENVAESNDKYLRPYNDFQSLPLNEYIGNRTVNLNDFSPLKAWVTRFKIRHMMWKVQVGIELDLFRPEELSSMYWLLAHFANSYVALLLETQAFNLARSRLVLPQQALYRSRIRRVVEDLEHDIQEAKATYHLAAALSNLYALLAHLQAIPNPFSSPGYSDAETRYNQRMKAFLPISHPSCPSFDQMSTLVTLQLDPNSTHFASTRATLASADRLQKGRAILSLVEQETTEAKKAWSAWAKKSPEQGKYVDAETWWKKDVQNTLKSAVACGLVCATLREGMKGGEGDGALGRDMDMTFPKSGERFHKSWLVPKISLK